MRDLETYAALTGIDHLAFDDDDAGTHYQGEDELQAQNEPTYQGVDGCPHFHYFPGVAPTNCAYCQGTE